MRVKRITPPEALAPRMIAGTSISFRFAIGSSVMPTYTVGGTPHVKYLPAKVMSSSAIQKFGAASIPIATLRPT